MTRSEIKIELEMIFIEPMNNRFWNAWIEDERLALAAEYELPALKLHQPVTQAITIAGGFLYTMPSTYHKHCWQIRDGDTNGGNTVRLHRDISSLELIDPDHSDTATHISDAAVEGNDLAVYPLASETISLWYYQRPTVLASDSSSPTELPTEYHHSVLMPRLIIRGFRMYPELARESRAENTHALQYWRTRLREGLYGSRETGEVGMLNVFSKSHPPRRWGGRHPLP